MKKLILSLAIVATGTFAMAQQDQRKDLKTDQERKEMMEKKRAAHMEEMQKELNLSQTQVTQLNALHQKHQAERAAQRAENKDLRAEKMEEFKKSKQKKEDEMRQILTAEQFTKWQALKEKKMQERKSKMDARPMMKGDKKMHMMKKEVSK